MIAILSALLPTFALIILGYVLRQRRFLPDTFWPGAEKLTYFVTFPALLFSNTAKADLGSLPLLGIAGAMLGTIAICTLLILAIKPVLKVSPAAFSSLVQGAIRPNTYIGLAVAAALLGTHGLTVTALCVALVVPTVNVISVLACAHWGDNDRTPGVLSLLRDVGKNPLLMACVLGSLVNVIGIGLPPVIGPFLEVLGRAALPIGLLAVGAGLDLTAARQAGIPVGISTIGKLAISPAIAAGLCIALGLPTTDMAAVVLYAALPCSASAYVLARLMGGDAPMMASIITVHTLVAIASMPIIAILVHAV
ncbi:MULTISPECIES: AEC family transporter [Thalassospira]|mgnify:FL=1|uniref:AEC family transporter n=2 Tax=Thalassospira TaxID=168934 RepID=A0A358HXY4_9PROT|nr:MULTISPECIES: AEC family transporter [Thalassospira]PKR59287.1 transporter [Thalassospira lohafexi]HBV00020.1 AEC family transporter [Thalassospira lucentensis]HCW69675.1 AEC family transporter [Thalassospira lucentensis]|tara:strand:+ start:299506 stop:300429 length:924 start_codon:yes stop_codon:yes gene_type:complete